MSWFPDLSAYVYTAVEPTALNVGWLGAGHAFTTGAVDPVVRDLLVEAALEPVEVMRGWHSCDLCDARSTVPVSPTTDPSRVAFVGSGEIRVACGEAVFRAPTLVVHYLDDHRYAPPTEFCDAVRRAGGS